MHTQISLIKTGKFLVFDGQTINVSGRKVFQPLSDYARENLSPIMPEYAISGLVITRQEDKDPRVFESHITMRRIVQGVINCWSEFRYKNDLEPKRGWEFEAIIQPEHADWAFELLVLLREAGVDKAVVTGTRGDETYPRRNNYFNEIVNIDHFLQTEGMSLMFTASE